MIKVEERERERERERESERERKREGEKRCYIHAVQRTSELTNMNTRSTPTNQGNIRRVSVCLLPKVFESL